jgi:hypothetical protein
MVRINKARNNLTICPYFSQKQHSDVSVCPETLDKQVWDKKHDTSKKTTTPSASPSGVKLLRQASHNPDNVRKQIKSELNCPVHVISAISPKKTGKTHIT